MSSNQDTYIAIGAVCCIFIIFIIIMIYFLVKSKSEPTTPQPNPDNPSTDIPIPDVNPNVPELIRDLSINNHTCKNNTGSTSSQSMYVENGCEGIFTFKGKIGYCGGYPVNQVSSEVSCPIGSLIDDVSGNVKGLIDPKIELVKDYSNNKKCSQGHYGLVNYNNMFVDNGCNGIFRIGSLIGECGSKTSTGKVTCPIGYTTTGPDGNQIGLKYYPYEFNSSQQKNLSTCQSDIYNKNYGLQDKNTFYTTQDCSGTFNWGNQLTAYCHGEYDTRVTCPVNPT